MPVAKCQDCGTVLLGRWCHACGQDSRDPLRRLRDVLSEYLDAAFSLDAKLPRTLIALVFEPGRLTTEYWTGHRTRWVTPLRLYLGISFLAFLGFALVIGHIERSSGTLLSRLSPVPLEQGLRHLPVLMFLLMPLFAALLKLLHAAQGRRFLEHLVLALHFHCFAFTTQVFGALVLMLALLMDAPPALPISLSVLVHGSNALWLFLALRRAYGLGVLATLVRYLGVSVGYTLALFGALYLFIV